MVEINLCANSGCEKTFKRSTHNQKYCSDECCRIATNRRIMEKYYEKKAIKNGARNPCKGCGAQLSRYSKSQLCTLCERSSDVSDRETLRRMFSDVV